MAGGTTAVRNGADHTSGAYDYGAAVGKADALILKTDDWAAMIDTGEERDGSYIRETLEAAGIDHLNLLLVTHFDKDHVGSAAELLETVGADQVLMPDYEGTRPEYAAFLSALEVHPETEVQRITGTETLEILQDR